MFGKHLYAPTVVRLWVDDDECCKNEKFFTETSIEIIESLFEKLFLAERIWNEIFNAISSFRNRILISIASNSRNNGIMNF